MAIMSTLVGTPSADAPAITASGRQDTDLTVFVSMSKRHPERRDADYLAWHSLDHRPEQHRLNSLRASFRLVSTPACRAARAASAPRYDATDHLMTYLFSDPAGLEQFNQLSIALAQAGRTPYLLPSIERSVYRVAGRVAAPRIKVGADVLPWWPAKGVYVLIEQGEASGSDLIEVPGVGGAWWSSGLAIGPPYGTQSNAGLRLTYCFLDDDPVQTAERLRPLLEKRWARSGIEPLLAAPFQLIVPYDWGRHLPWETGS